MNLEPAFFFIFGVYIRTLKLSLNRGENFFPTANNMFRSVLLGLLEATRRSLHPLRIIAYHNTQLLGQRLYATLLSQIPHLRKNITQNPA